MIKEVVRERSRYGGNFKEYWYLEWCILWI